LHGSLDDNLALNLKVIEQKLAVFKALDYSSIQDMFSATAFPDCVFRRKSPLDSDSFRHLIPI